jgi:hypothetical protein
MVVATTVAAENHEARLASHRWNVGHQMHFVTAAIAVLSIF